MLQMGYRTRIQYTEADKALMWQRSHLALTLAEREAISRGVMAGRSGQHGRRGPWSAEEETVAAPAAGPRDAPVTASHAEDT